MTPDTLTEMAHTEESRSGLPLSDIHTTVSINNISTLQQPDAMQVHINNLATKIAQANDARTTTNKLEKQVSHLTKMVEQICVNHLEEQQDYDDEDTDDEISIHMAAGRPGRPPTRMNADTRRGRSVKDLTRSTSQENRARRTTRSQTADKDPYMQRRTGLNAAPAATAAPPAAEPTPAATSATAPPRAPTPTPRRSSSPAPDLRRYPSYERDRQSRSERPNTPTFDLRPRSASVSSYYRDKAKKLEGQLEEANKSRAEAEGRAAKRQEKAEEPAPRRDSSRPPSRGPDTRKTFQPMHNIRKMC